MYKQGTEGLLKHYDFLLFDIICLEIVFQLAYLLSGLGCYPYKTWLYCNMGIWMIFADVIVMFLLNTFHGVVRRGIREEFLFTVRHVAVLCCLSVLYLFILQLGGYYSRLALFLNFILYAVLTFAIRLLWKRHLQNKWASGIGCTLLVVTTPEIAESVIEDIKENDYVGYTIAGLVLIDAYSERADISSDSDSGSVAAEHRESDRDPDQNPNSKANLTRREMIAGIPVVADCDNAAMYVCHEWIDEVIVVPPENAKVPQKLMEGLQETGVTIHLKLAKVFNISGKKQQIEKIGGFTVLSTSINYASSRQLFLKRTMDVFAGLTGCIITGILFLFIAPAIYINSPGPIFFSQERVGENGKKFRIFKFRSMYLDAEERKAALMNENKMSDGKMFKMDFDPRVIGNRILSDGTKKTGLGQFLRNSSLDEFPQFFNVLKGEMSLVGTRPPLVSEVSEYELHHRVRLSIKPGITGLWQVSGRSEITDFEEVVRLDRQYISEWSLWLDIKILFRTVWVVLKRKGSS